MIFNPIIYKDMMDRRFEEGKYAEEETLPSDGGMSYYDSPYYKNGDKSEGDMERLLYLALFYGSITVAAIGFGILIFETITRI